MGWKKNYGKLTIFIFIYNPVNNFDYYSQVIIANRFLAKCFFSYINQYV